MGIRTEPASDNSSFLDFLSLASLWLMILLWTSTGFLLIPAFTASTWRRKRKSLVTAGNTWLLSLVPAVLLTSSRCLRTDHESHRLGGEERRLMHLVPAPAVRRIESGD